MINIIHTYVYIYIHIYLAYILSHYISLVHHLHALKPPPVSSRKTPRNQPETNPADGGATSLGLIEADRVEVSGGDGPWRYRGFHVFGGVW